jgi:hypothetical protein
VIKGIGAKEGGMRTEEKETKAEREEPRVGRLEPGLVALHEHAQHVLGDIGLGGTDKDHAESEGGDADHLHGGRRILKSGGDELHHVLPG